jgi:hypothetical protein
LARRSRGLGDVYKRQVDYTASQDGAYVIPPDMTATHVLQSFFSGYSEGEDGLEMIQRAKGRVKGHVDLQKAKLSGVFSVMKPTINVDLNMLVGLTYTPEEVAAVNMHEIGHYFTFCEMVKNVVCTNQILAGLDRVLRGQDPKEIDIAFEAAGKELDIEKTIIEDAKKASDHTAALTVMVTSACRGQRNEYGDPLYDYNTCEMMADQFATRMGLGRELMTALDKLYKAMGVEWRKTKAAWWLSAASDALYVLLAAGLSGGYVLALGAGPLIATLVGGVILILLFFAHAHGAGITISDTLYETPELRCRRVRGQLIELAKSPRLSDVVAKKIIEDAKYLDKMADQYKELESIWGPIGRAIFSSVRRMFKSRDLQRDLEALALNDLFLKSLELKHA